jgi:hypothetical protein
MLTAVIVTLLVTASLGSRLDRNGGPIVRRPYNNRYNDASGAREDSFL